MQIIMCILKQQLESSSRIYHHRECNVRKLRSIELFSIEVLPQFQSKQG